MSTAPEAPEKCQQDSDTDLAIYRAALDAASAEVRRITDYMRSVNHNTLMITPDMRARREHLCQATVALSEIVKTLGTH